MALRLIKFLELAFLTQALAVDDMPAAISAARSMISINLYEVRLRFADAAALECRQLAEEPLPRSRCRAAHGPAATGPDMPSPSYRSSQAG